VQFGNTVEWRKIQFFNFGHLAFPWMKSHTVLVLSLLFIRVIVADCHFLYNSTSWLSHCVFCSVSMFYCIEIILVCVTSGASTTYLFGAPECIPVSYGVRVAQSIVFCTVLFYRLLFVFLSLFIIVLNVFCELILLIRLLVSSDFLMLIPSFVLQLVAWCQRRKSLCQSEIKIHGDYIFSPDKDEMRNRCRAHQNIVCSKL
jgi:hypothetical protein